MAYQTTRGVDSGLLVDVPSRAPVAAPKASWAGILADAIAGALGRPGMYAPMMQRQREQQQEEDIYNRRYQQQRADKNTDFAQEFQKQIQLLDYKRLHPDDALAQALDQAGITDPTERQKYYRADVERMTAPPMFSAPGTDEQGNPVMRFFPRAMPANPGAPPVGTVRGGYRFKGGNPADQSAWEPLGGPTQPASGTFR